MTRVLRFGLPTLTLTLTGLIAAAQPAAASIGAPGIEVEAKSPYCGKTASPSCGPATTSAADINYALVNAYSFTPRVTTGRDGTIQGADGRVDFVNVVCASGFEAARLTLFNGRGGSISGHVKVGKNPTESNDHALGETEFWATDGTTTAHVRGAQITSNLPDTLVAGGFNVTLTGPIVNLATGASRQGTMTCTTREPALTQTIVLDPSALPPDNLVAPPYFESVLNIGPDTDPS